MAVVEVGYVLKYSPHITEWSVFKDAPYPSGPVAIRVIGEPNFIRENSWFSFLENLTLADTPSTVAQIPY